MNEVFDKFEKMLCNLFYRCLDFSNFIVFKYFRIIEMIFIIIALIISFFIYEKNRERKIYNKEYLLYHLKINGIKSIIIITTSVIIANFINLYRYKVISYFFNKYMLMTILLAFTYYLIKYRPFKNSDDRLYNSEILYCKFINSYNYFILIFSSLFGTRYILMNLIGVFIVEEWIFYLQLIKDKSEDENSSEKLYKVREKQLLDFENILNKKTDENYAVALNGEWGSGKTTFLTTYMKRNKNDKFFIYIKPMVTDNMLSLLQQISGQLNNIMVTNGFDVGINKVIKSYYDAILKVIGEESKFSFNELLNIDKHKDTYLDLKEQLQNNINELYVKTQKKIIFIVDDFDRISEDKQETILDFIKEIINFKNTITVFAFDYKKVNRNKKINHEYLEKFVSYEVDLVKVNINEIINNNIENIGNKLKINNKNMLNICEDMRKIIVTEFHRFEIIQNEINEPHVKIPEDVKEEDYKKIIEMEKEKWSDLIKRTKNSRRMKQFFDNINLTLDVLNRKDYIFNETDLGMLNLSDILFVMNFLKVFDKDIFLKIIEFRSIDDYIIFWKEKCSFYDNNYIYKIMNKEPVKKDYDEESIHAEVEKWYIENITQNVFKPLNSNINSEALKAAKVRIINDLFIDYNVDDKKIKICTLNEELLIKIDKAMDNENEILFDENIDILEQLRKYEGAIFSSSDISRTKERIKFFGKKNAKLFIEGKISILNCFSYFIQSKSIDYVILYCKILVDNLPEYIEVYKQDKSTIVYHINEVKENNMRKYYTNFVYIIMLLSGKNNKFLLNEIYNQFYGFFDEKNVFNKIINIMNKNQMCNENIVNFEQLVDFMKNSIKQKYDHSNDIFLINKVVTNLDVFIYNKHYLENLIEILNRKLVIYRKFINIKEMKINELIEFIISLSEKKLIDNVDADNFGCALFWTINKLEEKDDNHMIYTKNEIIDSCKKLYNYIYQNKLVADDIIIADSANIQWLIDNYQEEEDEQGGQ